jgi:3-hydroxyacyl-[acyl-carrier-protein] dehydratase
VSVLTPAEVLERLPHREPFRFVDRIVEIDDEHVVAEYEWRRDADFYRGHFPGRPITPGVLLLESMAQAGVVALGIYLVSKEDGEPAASMLTVFSEATVEFNGLVEPGSVVRITGRKVFFRRRKLRAEVEMRLLDGTLVCSGTLAGVGVPR